MDDLDGTSSDDVSTVLFGLDGVRYEVDLNEQNANRLRNVVADYIDAARRTGGRIKRDARPAPSNGSARSTEASQIREWAQRAGVELAARGRIPAHVIAAYEEAKLKVKPMAKAAPATKRAKRRGSARKG